MQLEEVSTSYKPSILSVNRRNFLAGLWHGAFLALGVSLTEPTIVISAFVADLTGSTIWVGGLATVLLVAGALPQLFVARWIEPYPRKMPFLMTAIYLRVIGCTLYICSDFRWDGRNRCISLGIWTMISCYLKISKHTLVQLEVYDEYPI